MTSASAKQKPAANKSVKPNQAKAKPPAAEASQKTDFGKMSIAQLLAAEVAVKNELARRKRETKKGLMKEFQSRAKAAGLSMTDLLGTGKLKTTAPAKYRNPKNPNETWGGLGKRPTWLKTALGEGKTLQDLAIDN